MKFRKIIYGWWYLFYSAYWTAFNLGEKEEPESNAIYYFNLLIGFHLFGIMQLVKFWGYDFSVTVLIQWFGKFQCKYLTINKINEK